MRRFFAVVLACAPACASAPAPVQVASASPPAPTPPKPAEPSEAKSAPEPTCAPMPELASIAVPEGGPPVPPIVDEGDAGMAHAYARLAELARGAASDHVRIAVYGDSNMTSDFITGELRRVLQKRFGDGGHGFVDLAGHLFYHHMDVERGDDGAWTAFTLVNNPAPDGQYGFGLMAAESRRKGATTWVATAHDDAPIGKAASRFDLFFLKGPRFGSFDVAIDGARVATIDAHAYRAEAASERFTAKDGAHKITFTATGDKPVRLFGVALERSTPSVIVDSLGVTSADAKNMLEKNDARMWSVALGLRKYDLVVFLTGTNEFFGPQKHRAIMKSLIDMHRAAIPGVSILVLSPPDRVDGAGAVHTTWTLVETAREKKEIAAENRCAFWDLREAMGGDASALEFVRTRKMESDKRHFTREGGSWIADRLARALGVAFDAWARKNAGAACSK